ncbi:hypothetical protein jhhlp_008561 [Lomentospora prolificans]|uniref:DUF7703 domain-containing protein n=1 Tax=Lomentospora prolificans TaxID=41688 RepID=A0A2N3MYD8_9PEZI|nr:hypothetical protein jhhlp_008561 [Lomentospora prolificans]
MTRDNGISRHSTPTSATLIVILTFLSIALYNVVELNFIIFATFKKRSGLYFWSFVVATWGIAPYCIGFILKALGFSHLNWVYVTLIVFGWCATVTGQSVVLYSRLHIVVRNTSLLRGIVYMIIINAIICHIPTAVLVYGANSSNSEPFIKPYSIYEKVQVTIFFLQEVILSSLYIVETFRLVRRHREMGNSDSRHRRLLMLHLILVNIVVVILDITVLALEYAGLYDMQTACKALVYSIKLKVEFSILNKLVEIVRGSGGGSSYDRDRTQGDGVNMGPVKSGGSKGIRSSDRGVGNSTYVGAASKGNTQITGTSVMMTREIIVHREDVALSSDGDSDTATARDMERGAASRADNSNANPTPSSESVERLTTVPYQM